MLAGIVTLVVLVLLLNPRGLAHETGHQQRSGHDSAPLILICISMALHDEPLVWF